MRLGILVVIWIMFFNLSAQQAVLKDEVLAMFEKPNKVEWVKHYQGRINDMNDVAVTLASDGKNIKGELQYLRSKVRFYLTGEIKKGKFKLQEYDAHQQLSGFLEGEILEWGIRANWTNLDHSIGTHLKLTEAQERVEVPRYCGDNKWIRFYEGHIDKEKVSFVLQKIGEEKFTGTFLKPSKTVSKSIIGHSDIFDNVYLNIYDEMEHLRGKLEGTFDEQKRFTANFSNAKGKESTCVFKTKNQLTLGCVEYADYHSSYDILYPKTQHQAFNKRMDTLVSEWINTFKYPTEDKSLIKKLPNPTTRNERYAHVWPLIDIYNEDLISGQFIIFKNWTNERTIRNINYDFKNKSVLNPSDVFVNSFEYKKYVKQYLINRILQHKWAKEKAYIEWLGRQDFRNFHFRKDGLYFATSFHPVYGMQEVTIPYLKLKSFFNAHPIIQKFLKGKY